MKKYFIVLGILGGSFLLYLVAREIYIDQKQKEQLLYNVCKEQGCSDDDCKLFSTVQGSCEIKCSSGRYIKKW